MRVLGFLVCLGLALALEPGWLRQAHGPALLLVALWSAGVMVVLGAGWDLLMWAATGRRPDWWGRREPQPPRPPVEPPRPAGKVSLANLLLSAAILVAFAATNPDMAKFDTYMIQEWTPSLEQSLGTLDAIANTVGLGGAVGNLAQQVILRWVTTNTTSENYVLLTIYRVAPGAPGPRYVTADGTPCTEVIIGVLDHFIPWSCKP